MTVNFALLPFARTQIAARATAAGGTRLTFGYDLQVTGDGQDTGSPLAITASLRGPGDVIALQRGAIARVEPKPGLRGFETDYFPFIEFVDADFPWRYSVEAGGGERKSPWLALIALRAEEFEAVGQGSAPLPAIRVLDIQAALPDLSQAWAWAHVQVSLAGAADSDADAAMAADAANSFSRLLCCRRLEPRTGYFLFLVPVYAAGVLAGRGERDVSTPLGEKAWAAGQAGSIVLPYYHQSRFTTDAQEDVETLLRRLRPLSAEQAESAGASRRASAADPGYYPGYANPGATFEIQSALRQVDAPASAYDTDPGLAARMQTTLMEVIGGETADEDGNDPLVAFPPYGFRFRQEAVVSVQDAEDGQWFDRINFDLKMRLAAATGAEVVRRNQELLAKLCWDQYAEIVEANRRLARLQAAEKVVEVVTGRHFVRLAPDVALSLAEPMQPFVRTASGTMINEALRLGGTGASYASRALRRLAARRPVSPADDATAPERGIPTPAIPGDLTPGRYSVRADVQPPAGRQGGMLAATGLGGEFGVKLRTLLGPTAFKTAERPRVGATPVLSFRSAELVTQVVQVVRALPQAKADFSVGGRVPAEVAELAPIYRSPVVPLPLVDFLDDFSRDTVLSGVSDLPRNTVSVYRESRPFLESFMVGANTAMNDELRWREFPTDMRGTVLRRFWNRGRPLQDPDGDDITPISGWSGNLGNNPSPADADHDANLVFVIRGDIIRKLGNLIVTVNIADTTTWEENGGKTHEPVFFGRLGEDTAYFGFDLSHAYVTETVSNRAFFVIYEPMGRLRFGLDVATATIRAARQSYKDLALPFPVSAASKAYTQFRAPAAHADLRAAHAPGAQPGSWDELSWSHMLLTGSGYIRFNRTISIAGAADYWGTKRTSASLARSFWQKPVAAVVPVKRLINA